MRTAVFDRLCSWYSVTPYFCCSVLYNEGHATVPKLAEKLTLELVHHIQVNTSWCSSFTVHYGPIYPLHVSKI